MKKVLIFLPLFLLANSSMMPPMMPSVAKSKKVDSSKKTKKTTFPKECQALPPMLIFMPPPLEESLESCKNKLNTPKREVVKKKFKSVVSIKEVKGFSMLYEITTKKNRFYCNKDLSKCFEVKKLVK